jgi:hypothetical protein
MQLTSQHLRVAVPPHSPQLTWYSLDSGITPRRADNVVVDNWWVVSKPYHRPLGKLSLLFVRGDQGDIPQCSEVTENIDLMKRILFPWADVLFIPKVYLIRHKKNGWQIPEGLEYNSNWRQ